MSERSGMEMLEELLREVRRLNQKVDVLDRMVKQVANSAKISEIATKALETPLKDWTVPVAKPKGGKAEAVSIPQPGDAPSGMRFKFEPSDAAKTTQEAPNRSTRSAPVTTCMCEGKMVASNKGQSVPLPNIQVSIYDSKDALVKQTKTNRAGIWMSKLPPGKYVALCEGTYNGQTLYPVNIGFEVKPGMERLEVN